MPLPIVSAGALADCEERYGGGAMAGFGGAGLGGAGFDAAGGSGGTSIPSDAASSFQLPPVDAAGEAGRGLGAVERGRGCAGGGGAFAGGAFDGGAFDGADSAGLAPSSAASEFQ